MRTYIYFTSDLISAQRKAAALSLGLLAIVTERWLFICKQWKACTDLVEWRYTGLAIETGHGLDIYTSVCQST